MKSEQHSMLQEDQCPIADAMLGEMYRASPMGLNELVATVPTTARALLALYCFRRGHLASIGLTIAATCEKQDLIEWGQNAGEFLFDRSRGIASLPERQASGHRPITLATEQLRHFGLSDDEINSPDAETA